MSALSRDQFIACLKKSKAMDDESVDSWMSRVDDENPKMIASKLVRDKMLTQWQAKLLLSGRSRLTVGNYRLLSRINRDELGDRFEAIHSQLGRKVVIQIFPSSINKNDELRVRVLKAMQQMTELDHPGLVHVYDVDQEGDRYFVVTEFVDGAALSELPRGDLKDSDVASFIADLISGVKYAHQEGVIHGNILQENVLVTAQSRGKLQGLPTSAVQCEMLDSSGKLSHQQDFIAISQLGRSVLQEVPPKRRGEGYEKLVKIVTALASAEGSVLEKIQLKLAQWLATYGPQQPVANLGTAGAPPMAKSISGTDDALAQQGGSDAPVAALPATKLTKKKKAEPELEPEAEPASFLSKMWNEKRALSLAAIAATVLTLVGGIGAAGYLLTQPAPTGGDNSNAVATKDHKEKRTTSLAMSAARPNDALDPEANKRKIEEMYAKRNAAAGQPAGSDADFAARAARREAKWEAAAKEEAAASVAVTTPVEVKLVPEKTEETKTVAATKSPAGESKTAETEMAKTAAKPAKKQKPSTKKDNPFAGLPETVDLPASTETGDLKIADVTIDKRYLMGLELLTGPEVCKHKFVFDLKRSASDKQLWDIRMQRRKRDDPLPVAQIQKTPSELKFRWLPAAEEFDDANFIRNCKIKLSAAKDIGWIGLRKPVDIQNFGFQSGKTSVKTDVDLKWLPNPQGVKIELDPFQVEEKDRENHRGKVVFAPREVLKKEPGLIFFREKEDLRFFFVEVGVDIRSKLKMQAQMYALGANGAPRPLRKPAELLQLADVLAERKVEAERYQATIAQVSTKPAVVKMFPSLKEEKSYATIAAKAKRETLLATRQHVACGDYVKIVQTLDGLRIPFQVFFDMDGHRIKLAQSTAEPFKAKTKK